MSSRAGIRLSLTDERAGALERLAVSPSVVSLSLHPFGRQPAPVPCVSVGQAVTAGECVAESVHTRLHASISGRVTRVSDEIRIEGEAGVPWVIRPNPELPALASRDFEAFLAMAGIVGMGGAQFPAALKFAASRNVHTVIVNGVECEPGVTIDAAILLRDTAHVRAGAEAVRRAVGAREVLLAVKRGDRFSARLAEVTGWRVVSVPARYPAGAERLILERLTGRCLPAGFFPLHVGYLVHNVATVRAIGLAAESGVPCVERPLSLMDLAAGRLRNVVVPVGMPASEVLTAFGWTLGPGQGLVAGGLMMGQGIDPSRPVGRGTTSLTCVDVAKLGGRERPCIRCGACHDACPVGLHPIDLVERATCGRPLNRLAKAHLDECFLCGVCSAVCPSHIPIAARLREARRV